MSLVPRPPDPRKRDLIARTLSEALLGIGSPFVRELVAGVVLIGLMVLVLPLAVLVFIVTSLLYLGVLVLLGTPTGTLGAALGLTWFGGSLVLIGFLLVLAWRRVGFIRVIAGLASESGEEEPPAAAMLNGRDPNANADTVLRRVATADARLADSAELTEDDDRPTSTER
jgi:hypothetical protein